MNLTSLIYSLILKDGPIKQGKYGRHTLKSWTCSCTVLSCMNVFNEYDLPMCLDGPQMPTIMGPRAAKTGDNATFSCHALSNPSGSYSWFFNNSQVSNMSDYVTPPLNKNMSGKYTCMVFNNITGKNSTAYRMLTVFGEIWIFLFPSKIYFRGATWEKHLTVGMFCFITRFTSGITNASCHRG